MFRKVEPTLGVPAGWAQVAVQDDALWRQRGKSPRAFDMGFYAAFLLIIGGVFLYWLSDDANLRNDVVDAAHGTDRHQGDIYVAPPGTMARACIAAQCPTVVDIGGKRVADGGRVVDNGGTAWRQFEVDGKSVYILESKLNGGR